MNLRDLLIIYLAGGAPIGVYYFLRNRSRTEMKLIWLKTLLCFLFWIPFAVLLVRRRKNFKFTALDFGKTFSAEEEANRQTVLFSVQKQLENFFLESGLNTSVYEFREIVERYVGLAIINSNAASTVAEREKEIFRISKSKNVELGAICFTRRNRTRLFFHQTGARKDFLQLIEKLLEPASNKIGIEQSAIRLADILDDTETRLCLEKIFAGAPQTEHRQSVRQTTTDLWNTDQPKPPLINPVSIPSPVLTTAAASLRRKD